MSKYSTARSGLLKAALIARSINDLSKPMLSISAIAAARCDPIARADGSLKVEASAPAAPWAGVGVDGTLLVALPAAGPGAGGGAGVEIIAGAGVEGGLAAVDDEADEVVGAAVFGWLGVSIILDKQGRHGPSESYTL